MVSLVCSKSEGGEHHWKFHPATGGSYFGCEKCGDIVMINPVWPPEWPPYFDNDLIKIIG